MRTMPYVLAVALAAIVSLALLGSPALAEDVTVKVITPDPAPPASGSGSATSSTAAPTGSGSATSTAPSGTSDTATTPAEPASPAAEAASLQDSGDRTIDRALRRLELTAPQVGQLNPILTSGRQQRDAADAKRREALSPLTQQWAEAARKAREAGDAANTEVEAIRARIQAINDEFDKQRSAAREQLVGQIVPVLTAEQAQLFKQLIEESTTPAGQARGAARMILSQVTRGLELTPQQQAQLEQLLADRILKITSEQEANARAVGDLYQQLRQASDAGDSAAVEEIRNKINQARSGFNMRDQFNAAREELEKVLTEEQKAKLAEQQRAQSQQMTDRMLDFSTRGTENLGLTAEQQKQIDDLKAAARSAMEQLDGTDFQARIDLVRQLRTDIANVLTDEQKEKFNQSSGFGRGGNQGDTGGRRGGRRGGRGGQPADTAPSGG